MYIAHRSMDRRQLPRIPTDLPLLARSGGRTRRARAIDLSPRGALLRGGFPCQPLVQQLLLDLGRGAPLLTLARTVWADDQFQAVRFVGLEDVSRLDIAEHLDAIERGRRQRRWALH